MAWFNFMRSAIELLASPLALLTILRVGALSEAGNEGHSLTVKTNSAFDLSIFSQFLPVQRYCEGVNYFLPVTYRELY
jgi:hypothetical protein